MKVERDHWNLTTARTSDLDVLASIVARAGTKCRVVASCSAPDDVEMRGFEPGAADNILLIIENRARVDEGIYAAFDTAGTLIELRIIHGPREFLSRPASATGALTSASRKGGR